MYDFAMQFEFTLNESQKVGKPRTSLLSSERSHSLNYFLGQLSLPAPVGVCREDIAASLLEIPLSIRANFNWKGSFCTRTGSNYEMDGEGKTVRTQYRRVTEFATPIVHDRSHLTLFVSPDKITIARFQLNFRQDFLRKSKSLYSYLAEKIYFLKDGSIGWISFPSSGEKGALTRFFSYSFTPQVGLAPLELWWNDSTGVLDWHEGHAIVKCESAEKKSTE